MLRGCFLALDLLDPIGHRFRRGKYVVQGGAVIRGRLVLVVLNHMMNTAEKGFPCGRFILLHISILLREVYIMTWQEYPTPVKWESTLRTLKMGKLPF